MGFFSQIRDKIFGHRDEKTTTPVPTSATPAAAAAGATTTSSTPAPAPAPVDVGAVLASMAEMQGGGGNYQTSIVDLLKLLQLDSSLEARKSLAEELGVNVGAPGTPEQNIALHRAVMKKLAENGGQVPDSFYK